MRAVIDRSNARRRLGTLARIVAAVFGGYALAALTSVAAIALPLARTQAVLVGMLLSFVVYTGTVIWAFAARDAKRVWLGMICTALPLMTAAIASTGHWAS